MEKEITSRERILYYDFLRGIAIIFLFFIHSFSYCFDCSNKTFIAIFFRQVLNCAVPIFCAFSAHFLWNIDFSLKSNNTRIIKPILRVYIPMLVCSFPYLIISCMNKDFILSLSIKYFIGSYSIYYFVILIIQFYYLLTLFGNTWLIKCQWLYFLGSLIWFGICVYYLHLRYNLPLLLYASPVFAYLQYFLIDSNLQKVRSKKQLLIFYVLIFFLLILCTGESYFIMNKSANIKGVGVKPTSVLFSSLLLFVLFTITFKKKYTSFFSKVINLIGNIVLEFT